MNKVFLIGNLADEPKTSMTAGGTAKCSFRLAVQRKFTNPQTGQREADFIPVVAWRQTGELCTKYLSKGRKCAVCGSIQTRSYDAQDGSRRYVTEVIADEVQFLGSPARQQGNQEAAQGETPDGFTAVEDGDLPF